MARIRIKTTEIRRGWRDIQDHLTRGDEVIVVHYNRAVALITPYQEEPVTTTTSYGTWTNVFELSAGVAQHVIDAVGDYADEYDLEALEHDFREEIGDLLPSGVVLAGDEFIGPYYDRPEFDRDELREAIEGIDFWEIAARYER